MDNLLSNNNIKKLMAEARDLYTNTVKDTEKNLELLYGFKRTFLEESIVFTYEELKEFDDTKIQEIYDKYYVGEESDRRIDIADMREDLLQAKEMSNIVFRTKDDYKELEDIYSEHLDAQWKQNHSKKSYDAKMKRVEEFKEILKEMTPGTKKYKEIENKIAAVESSLSMDFILERIQTLTEKERSTIIRQFFNNREGSYIMERCASRVKKFNLPDQDWFKFFFNLEEKFLPEEYHVYNNLFLYAVMRFIAYADPYSKRDQMYVHSIISNLTGLIYHKFEDKEMEDAVIDLIKRYDSFFSDYYEKFDKENINHPNHPERLEYSAKREVDRKNSLLEAMEKFGIPITDALENATADEMQKYFNDEMDKLIAKNNEDTKEPTGAANVKENEDGTVTITPSFEKMSEENDGRFYYYGEVDADGNGDSFYQMYKELEKAGVKNCKFMLELKNPDVPTKHIFDDNVTLQPEEIEAIRKEARENLWYYLRFCVRLKKIPTTYRQIESNYMPFELNQYGVALGYNLLNILTGDTSGTNKLFTCASRCAYKTVAVLAIASWIYNFSEEYNVFALYGRNRDRTDSMYNTMVYNILDSLPKFLLSGKERASQIQNKKLLQISDNEVWEQCGDTSPCDIVIADDYEFNPYIEQRIGDANFMKNAIWILLSTPADTSTTPNINRKLAEIPAFTKEMYDNPVVAEELYVEIPPEEVLTQEHIDSMKKVLPPSVYRREILLERFANTNDDGTVDEKYDTEYDYETRRQNDVEEVMEDRTECPPSAVKKLLDKMEYEGTKSVEEFLEGSIYPESGSEIN